MDEGLFLQEYYVSFERGIEGSIYGRVLDQMRLDNRIGPVSWNPTLLTHVAIDIGVNDATTMVWFQTPDNQNYINIIDCYSNTGMGLDHYIKILQDKPYKYGKYFAPHDLKVREFGGGAVTRYEKARQLGLNFIILDQTSVQDGIDNVLANFSKMYIDQEKCRSLIDALENYKKEYDDIKQMYKNKPLHSWAAHFADSIRYMCQALHLTKKGMTTQEFDRKKAEALYGNQFTLPPVFRKDNDYGR